MIKILTPNGQFIETDSKVVIDLKEVSCFFERRVVRIDFTPYTNLIVVFKNTGADKGITITETYENFLNAYLNYITPKC